MLCSMDTVVGFIVYNTVGLITQTAYNFVFIQLWVICTLMLLCSKEHDKTIDSLCLDLGS
jgi:hypothetical protein